MSYIRANRGWKQTEVSKKKDRNTLAVKRKNDKEGVKSFDQRRDKHQCQKERTTDSRRQEKTKETAAGISNLQILFNETLCKQSAPKNWTRSTRIHTLEEELQRNIIENKASLKMHKLLHEEATLNACCAPLL